MIRTTLTLQPVLLIGFVYGWFNTLQCEPVSDDPVSLCIGTMQMVAFGLAAILKFESNLNAKDGMSASASLSYVLLGMIAFLLPVVLLVEALSSGFSLGFLSASITVAAVLHYCCVSSARG